MRTKLTILAAIVCAGLPQAHAAWTYNQADLIIGFQATGGTGSNLNLFFNLGDSVGYLNGANHGFKADINDSLVAAFGAGWASRTDVRFGVMGNRSNTAPTLDPGNPPTDEKGRVVYGSSATTVPGAALLRGPYSSSGLSYPANEWAGTKTILGALNEISVGEFVAVLNEDTNPVEWNQSWTTYAGDGTDPLNPPYGAFNDLENTFGAGEWSYVDVQRYSPTPNTSEYVMTVGINDLGQVYVIPEPSSILLGALAPLGLLLRRRRNG